MNRRQLLEKLLFSSCLLGVSKVFAKDLINNIPAKSINKDPIMVLLFLRGGADGLSLTPPVSSKQVRLYKSLRKELIINKPLNLPGNLFGLHPSFTNLKNIIEKNEGAVFVGAGSKNNTRSHFVQQDYIESGHHLNIQKDGFLNRFLKEQAQGRSSLSGVSIGDDVSFSLSGNQSSLSLSAKKSKKNKNNIQNNTNTSQLFDALYSNKGDCSTLEALEKLLCEKSSDAKNFLDKLTNLNFDPFKIDQVKFGKSQIGNSCGLLASMIKADLGLNVLTLEMSGWDTHARQGVEKGGFQKNVEQLDKALSALVADAKENKYWNRLNLFVVTEFGRTARQNGTLGSDHGRGSSYFYIGNHVKKNNNIIAPNYDLASLYEDRDVRVEIDFRDIFSDAFQKIFKMNSKNITKIFPDFKKGNYSYFT